MVLYDNSPIWPKGNIKRIIICKMISELKTISSLYESWRKERKNNVSGASSPGCLYMLADMGKLGVDLQQEGAGPKYQCSCVWLSIRTAERGRTQVPMFLCLVEHQNSRKGQDPSTNVPVSGWAPKQQKEQDPSTNVPLSGWAPKQQKGAGPKQ